MTAMPMQKQTKQRRKNLIFSSPLIIINMGCEVTSVYNDEITGKMGYSQPIIDDLLDRDFRKASPMSEPDLKGTVTNIEGFTQSFATGRLFFSIVGEHQNVVYSAGRFIVAEEVRSRKRRFIANKDMVSSFAVREKLCLVGLNGGYLVLWDLEFLEVKLQVMLPEGSLAVTSVGLTSQYLFATDASQPNNLAFSYNIRTAQLKAASPIPSLEPALRSISVGEDKHVTACADGVWFIQAEKNSDKLQVVRGMFGHYPKTSMVCLAQAGGYVLSGGVDGYLYAWRISTLRCAKALKVHDDEITAIMVKDNLVVIACTNSRVKIYSYKVTKNEKKGNQVRAEEQEQEGRAQEDDELLTFVLVDSFDKEGVVFAMASSNKDPLLYYCMTRHGLLFQKRLPANDIAPSKKSLSASPVQDLMRINSKAEMLMQGDRLYSVYLMSEKLLFMDVHKVEKDSLLLFEERVAKLQSSCDGAFLACLPIYSQVAYAAKNGRIMVAETFGKVGDALNNANQSNFGQNTREVLCLPAGEEMRSLSFIHSAALSFLAITTTSSVFFFQREGRLTFEQKLHIKYEKQIPVVEMGGKKLVYESTCRKWRDENEDWHAFDQKELQRQELLLCSKTKSTDNRWAKICMGQGVAFFLK